MKLQYNIVVNVVIHISKSKGVAEWPIKQMKKGLSKVTSFTIHHVYSYREVPMFSLNLLNFLIESRDEWIISSGISCMSVWQWLGWDRKCSETVVGLDWMLVLSTERLCS